MLWAVFTLIAAAAQTARNAMQRELTATLGTVGATHVRFLFGFPFALLFLAGVMLVDRRTRCRSRRSRSGRGSSPARSRRSPPPRLMLAAMGERSFVVAYRLHQDRAGAGRAVRLIFLGDKVTPLLAAAILIATAGVIVMSLKPGAGAGRHRALDAHRARLRRAVRAVGDRLSRRDPVAASADDFVLAATFTRDGRAGAAGGAAVALSRAARSRRAARDRRAPGGRRCSPASWARSPRSSGFSPSPSPRAANVRTLALVEVLFAQGDLALHLQAADHARANGSASC